jgi:opacity protein-like surface antigen
MKKVILIIAAIIAININVNAQSKISLGVNGGLSIPVTELGRVYSITPSAEINAGYRLLPDMDLILTAGYSNFKYRNENLNDDIHTIDKNANMNEAWTAMVIPVTAGIRYQFDPISKKVFPYGTAELGAFYSSFDKRLGGSIVLTGSNITTLAATKESQLGVGLVLGIGTFFNITPRISVDVSVKYNFVKTDFIKDYVITKDTLVPYNVAGISTGMYLTTRVGINVKLY